MKKESLKPHQKIIKEINLKYKSVGELLREKAALMPDEKFIFYKGKEDGFFTYKDFYQQVCIVSKYLRKIGLSKGDRINLIIPNSPEFVLLYFAALDSGIVVVPINEDLSPFEYKYIIRDSNSKVAFYDKSYKYKIDQIRNDIETVEFIPLKRLPDFEPLDIDLNEEEIEVQKINVGLSDTAVIIYTSGTTGKPKGVVLIHLNLLADAKAISDWFHFSKETVTLCILPLFHNNGQIVTLLTPLYAGGSTVIVRGKASLMSFWELVKKYKVTFTSVMASILSILLSIPFERKDNSLQGIICGGQVLTENVKKRFENRFGVPIFEGYGLTETTSFCCFNNFPAEKRKKGSIGKSLPICEMAIIDELGKELPPFQEGEICIRGYNVAKEYLELEEANRKAFDSAWFHSGDYGFKDKDNYYYFRGRRDSLIIKGGENIYPSELENVLYQNEAVAEAAVIGIPDDLLGEDVAAFVKLKDSFHITEQELLAFCEDKIANFKQAKKIIIINNLSDLNEIPKGPTKKVLYNKIKEYYLLNFK